MDRAVLHVLSHYGVRKAETVLSCTHLSGRQAGRHKLLSSLCS